jgi:hypothetical protein
MKQATILLSIFSLIFATLSLNAQEKLFTETLIKKDIIEIDKHLTLSVSNTNGDIDILYWDKNIVEYQAEIKATGWDKDETREFCENIGPIVEFDTTKCNCIRISMDYKHFKRKCDCKGGDQRSIYKSWFKKIEVKDFSINYRIFIPEDLKSLHVRNSYGNVEIDRYKGKLRLQLIGGLLKSDSLDIYNNSNINLTKSLTDIGYLSSMQSKINIMHCKNIQLKQCFADHINSKNSTISADLLKVENFISFKDSIRINSFMNSDFIGSYSKLFLNEVSGSSVINLKTSGMVKVENYSSVFSELKLKGKYSIFEINLPDRPYFFQSNISNSRIIAPDIFSSDIKPDANFNNLFKTAGNKDAQSIIRIDCNNCDIELKETVVN